MDKLIANDAKDTICMKMYNVSFYHERYYTKFRQIFGYSQVPLKKPASRIKRSLFCEQAKMSSADDELFVSRWRCA